MKRSAPNPLAVSDPKAYYNARYDAGYMKDFRNLYEACRLHTMRYVFAKMKQESVNPRSALDYGCGEGRYLAVLKEFFPQMRLAGCDISEVGLRLAKKHHPFAEFRLMRDETTDFPDRSFDLVISVEVLEHVGDVTKSAKEIDRLLAGGADHAVRQSLFDRVV